MSITLFFGGYKTVSVSAAYAAALLDLCLRHSISYRDFACDGEGNLSFRVSLLAAKKLIRLCKNEGIALKLTPTKGLPAVLWRYRKRAGLWAGSLLAIALLVASGRFVWDVRVTGNNQMSATEVKAELKACGFGVGSYIPDLRTEELENRVLIVSDRISWISVHMDGTVAKVQVIEHTEPPAEESARPANLVAARDGQIELLELYRGNCMVKIGQAVKAGELLVSGLYDSTTEGIRFTRAAGSVLARTEHVFEVEIPLEYTARITSTPVCAEKTLNFFDFSIKIFKSTGNEGGMCDIIKEEKGVELFGVCPLPLSVTSVMRVPYTEETRTRTPEEALEAAYTALAQRLSAFSPEVQLLRKEIGTTLTDTSLILTCTVTCIEDIAVQQEFDVTEQ